MKELFRPEQDSYFAFPYIDMEEWREKPVRHYFVHGGFKGTKENGTEVRFAFYFPEKEKYEDRFYQYLSPAPEYEREPEALTGEEDKIGFALRHGSYLVVSNQGGFQMNDPSRLYKSSASTAQFSRKVAQAFYNTKQRPYGYCFGGSGGSFKTLGCMECTEGIWDGAVPYVIANPMAAPNNFAPRVRVMRVLGKEGIARIVDAMEPGGNGDIYEGLTPTQQNVLREASRMGFPIRAWFAYPKMGAGALPVLTPYIYQVCPEYFTDFWTKEGYAGADPDSPEAQDRVKFATTVAALIAEDSEPVPSLGEAQPQVTNVDNSWQASMDNGKETPGIRLTEMPPASAYLEHARVRILSGKAAGKSAEIDRFDGDVVYISNPLATGIRGNLFEGLAVSDEIMIDNSDYIAMSMLQRHQVPDDTYHVYDQYRGADGKPLYPQLPALVAPEVALNGSGTRLTGDFHGRMLAVCALLDESAFPWHGIWYREQAEKRLAERNDGTSLSDCFRLYYNDHCLHGDAADELGDPQHQIDYVGILHQALLDVAAWCEKGIEPLPSTEFRYVDGQFSVSDNAAERKGMQPVINALADGKKCVHVKVGEEVRFSAVISAPPKAGKPAYAAFDFTGSNDFTHRLPLRYSADESEASVSVSYTFMTPGTYFPVIKAASTRNGLTDDIFVLCKNLDRVRVVVESNE